LSRNGFGRGISVAIAILGLLLWRIPGATGLEDGRIGVLYVGCIARSPPFNFMRSDPLFSMGFVIATLRDWAGMAESEVHRRVRLYMPRTYRDLVSNFDVIVLANANRFAVGTHVEKLAQGVEEGSMGLLMSGGWETFGGTSTAAPPWGDSAVGKLLPTEDVIGIWVESGWPVIFDKPAHEFIRSIPWNFKDPSLGQIRWHHNMVKPRLGAEMLARVVSASGSEDPLMITWKLPNEARVFALTSEIHALSWYGSPWEYAIDFGSNLMIYLDNRPVPQDVALVHAARTKIFQVATRRSLLISLLDFCESFGANTRNILRRAGETDAAIAAAMPEYLQLRFEEMLDAYREVEAMLEEMEEDAIKLKNATLLWVYVVEWLTVTGTTLFCGFLLWSLMIRRRLYREVETTRLSTR